MIRALTGEEVRLMSTISNPVPHPKWCSLERCTATQGGIGAAHRSDPTVFATPMIRVELSLHRGVLGSRPETFLCAVASVPGGPESGTTMAVPDAWALVDVTTGLLDLVR